MKRIKELNDRLRGISRFFFLDSRIRKSENKAIAQERNIGATEICFANNLEMSEVIQITSKDKGSETIESINTASHRYKRLAFKILKPKSRLTWVY
ncbi:hypothetical protein I4641_02305 [Waterburya agarophytonicola K14]|uniref:Uncharacterized protein n=1 Tax=Waterburya agarophytonicola KI4 TaxID=2874699 RepID=A0A964FFT9_9CYAN|nr:hypothetical protein [Waterburya agarophytonicola]MCC0175813.1 hypothetical protein [Waterburya agarophytonicola KI4]